MFSYVLKEIIYLVLKSFNTVFYTGWGIARVFRLRYIRLCNNKVSSPCRKFWQTGADCFRVKPSMFVSATEVEIEIRIKIRNEIL